MQSDATYANHNEKYKHNHIHIHIHSHNSRRGGPPKGARVKTLPGDGPPASCAGKKRTGAGDARGRVDVRAKKTPRSFFPRCFLWGQAYRATLPVSVSLTT